MHDIYYIWYFVKYKCLIQQKIDGWWRFSVVEVDPPPFLYSSILFSIKATAKFQCCSSCVGRVPCFIPKTGASAPSPFFKAFYSSYPTNIDCDHLKVKNKISISSYFNWASHRLYIGNYKCIFVRIQILRQPGEVGWWPPTVRWPGSP